MDLNRVAVFVRVVDERSFTAAARALGLPKSSVSRAVTLLERELSVRLLQRSSRKLSLTEAGATFYEHASHGLAVVREAAAAAADMDAALVGPIRITASADAGIWMLASALAAFVKRNPGVSVEVVLTNRVVDLVAEGFDLALRAGPVRDESLVARRIGVAEAALYATPRYLARAGAPARLADLAAHACVLFRGQRGRATWTLAGPSGEESVVVSGLVSADDFTFVRRAVLCGAGIGLLPSFLCGREVERGRLARVLPQYAAPSGPLSLVLPSGRYVPHRVLAFREFLQRRLAQQIATCAGRGGDATARGEPARTR